MKIKKQCCSKNKIDYFLWGMLGVIVIGYTFHLTGIFIDTSFGEFNKGIYALINKMWFGIILGIIFVGVMSKVPKEFVISILGTGNGVGSILRASLAGVLLDLCSHGILLVGMKLYERGASIGQVMAFLISSPWNSISLTIILIALIGWKWTLLFIVLSMLIGLITGLIFDKLTHKEILPPNPHRIDLPENFTFYKEAKTRLASTHFGLQLFKEMAQAGAKESGMLIRWLLLGVILAALIRGFVSVDQFQTYFGASLSGLGLTLVAATIIEVCSEGATPIAADLLTRAQAPGNAFTFLMAGVSTDLTEILVLRETTKSWKIPLFLPLITLPQVLFIGILINSI